MRWLKRWLVAWGRFYTEEQIARRDGFKFVGTRHRGTRTVVLVQVIGRAVSIEMPILEAVAQRGRFSADDRYQLGILYGLEGKFGSQAVADTTVTTCSGTRGMPAISVAFVSCLILSTLTASKLVEVAGVIFPAGLVFFPLSFIFNDILTEVYGYHQSRKIIWSGVVANIAFMVGCQIAVALPSASIWSGQAAFEQVLGTLPRIALASVCAYLLGEFCNAYVIAKLKILTAGKYFWFRLIASSSCSIAVDSLVFCSIAFGANMDVSIYKIALAQYVAKLAYVVLAMPFTYIFTGFLKKLDRIDWYDHGTNFNPLAVFSRR